VAADLSKHVFNYVVISQKRSNKVSYIFQRILCSCVLLHDTFSGLHIDGLVDGDIMTSEQMINNEAQSKVKDQPEKRNAIRNYRYLWTDKIIPYEIHSSGG